jgi:desumoylating isopeptidase 1
MKALSFDPILFSQVPALDTVFNKLASFVSASSLSDESRNQVAGTLSQTVLPYLKSRFAMEKKSTLPSATTNVLASFASATKTIVTALPLKELFPVVDMWRLAFLDPAVGTWCASLPSGVDRPDPISIFLNKGNEDLDKAPRNYVLTLLRLLCNAFSSAVVAKRLLSNAIPSGGTAPLRNRLTTFLISTLLHQDAAVRTASASLAFNVAAYRQRGRVDKVRGAKSNYEEDEDGDWEVEMVSAVVEAIGREKESEEVGAFLSFGGIHYFC